MAFQIIRNDITKVTADAIVNTANPDVAIGDGVDSAIYEVAGQELLLAARESIGELPEGTVGVTPAFGLSARYIIHTSGPWWNGGTHGEEELLRSCYDKSLQEAYKLGLASIAFPLLSTGTYGFPREMALRIAVDAFSRFLEKYDMEIYLVVFDQKSVSVSEKMFRGLREYIDDNYVAGALQKEYVSWVPETLDSCSYVDEICYKSARIEEDDKEADSWVESDKPVPNESNIQDIRADRVCNRIEAPRPTLAFSDQEPRHGLDHYINNIEDPFCQYLQQLINKKGYKNSQVYKKANLTKQYFSKLMKSQVNPTKEKLLSIAVALELNMDETKDLLMMAGYAMSPCNKVDLVVAYFIRSKNYNMFDIEIALDDLGLPTLASY